MNKYLLLIRREMPEAVIFFVDGRAESYDQDRPLRGLFR